MSGRTRSVLQDRWDKEDHRSVCREIREFARARKLANTVSATGTDAVDDLFFVMLKAAPCQVPVLEMAPEHRINHFVIGQLMGTAAVRRLREITIGDRVLAALACVDLAPRLDAIFDRLYLAFRHARAAIDRQDVANGHERRLRQAEDELDISAPDFAEKAKAVERMRAEWQSQQAYVANAEEGLARLLEDASHMVRDEWEEAVASTAAAMATIVASARMWGTEPGQLRSLPAAERLELARRLNDERLRSIADLFGRIENLTLSSAAEEIDDVFEEVADLELGGDLSRVTPAELLMLGVPEMESRFLAQWCDRTLMQYEVHGTDDSGRGGIVMCIDGSMSMHGRREIFAKALMLVLLHTARRQHRPMYVIHFGYRQTKHFAFETEADYTAERILDATQAFWGSGTDFQLPMNEALSLLEAEYASTGRVRADVVFVSDDEYYLDPEFLRRYLRRIRSMRARTWGVLVDSTDVDPRGALALMSEGRVFSAHDLESGRDVRSMLTAVR
jgi:uncharacterized protein with von Willebrand factor type A (vWA) domain